MRDAGVVIDAFALAAHSLRCSSIAGGKNSRRGGSDPLSTWIMRGYWMGPSSWVGVFVAVGIGLASCGGSSDDDDEAEDNGLDGCLACADEQCPNQSAACDASATCQALRGCQLSCRAGDTACRNQCVSAAAGDTAGITAAANLVACAASACGSECPFAFSGTTGGFGGAPPTQSGGATAKGGAVSSNGGQTANTGGFVMTGTGGSAGPPPICQDLIEWATGCAVDTESTFRSCDAAPITQCKAGCYVDARCIDYDEVKAGEMNSLSVCLTACDISYGGGTVAPTCANAAGKFLICGITTEFECDDASALDRCLNQCTLDHDCNEIEDALKFSMENDFVYCYNACEGNVGGPNPDFVIDAGGYVTAGGWHGYAWTSSSGAPTTISPADFSTLPADGQLCASGTVAGTADYSAVAMLGLSIAQEPGDPAPAPTAWSSRGQGVLYNVTNRGASPLRIQIQAPGGDTDPNLRWCADVAGQSGDIFWHTFNTECWEGGAGTAYDGTPIESISVLVPGDLGPRAFDFCVHELHVNG